ncbi:MAG TPA: type II toxin-antitoxin system HicB family antitoxin [Azospirillaceae bacterium]|nr:type II toxin-antitoxin system HicB family antitoxin [Azospirillaceae bacterium]
MMEYKGYKAQIDFDNEAGVFHGEVINLREGITFHGRSVEELRHAFQGAVEDYLAESAARGQAAEQPFSGKFMIRLSPELHRRVAAAALCSGKPLNTWIADRLGEAVGPG